MKYPNRLFACTDRQLTQSCNPSATVISNLYSVTFMPNTSRHSYSNTTEADRTINCPCQQSQQPVDREELISDQDSVNIRDCIQSQVVGFKSGVKSVLNASYHQKEECPHHYNTICRDSKTCTSLNTQLRKIGSKINTSTRDNNILLAEDCQVVEVSSDNLRISNLKKSKAQIDLVQAEDDWIIVNSNSPLEEGESRWNSRRVDKLNSSAQRSRKHFTEKESRQVTQSHDMTLTMSDIDHIRASWLLMRQDPLGSGLLLFKGLFTKFPEYLKFFPAFADLNLDDMQEHRLLKKHAIKVIETVTFVVDSIGDLSKEEALNQALLGLVKGHLKRNVGLTEFRNLGIVLIDFICDINQRGAIEPIDSCTLTSGITSDNHIEDENQTSGNLDKIRGSSSQVISHRPPVLVAAWTKLYSNILDLVKHEEAELEASRLDTGTVRNSDMKITSDADAQVANAQGYDVGGGIDSKGLEGYGRGGSIGGGGDDNDGYCG